MLRATATAAAQLRESFTAATDAGIAELGHEGRPRSLVVCGMGGSAIAGDLLAGVIGSAASIPIVVSRGDALPGWVGAADLVVGVSSSGTTRETLSALDGARRRAARLVGVGAGDSPLADLVAGGRGTFVGVRSVLAPRASLWALATPLLALAGGLKLTDLGEASTDGGPPEQLEAAAARLEQVALSCRPDLEGFVNMGKELALALGAGLPIIWGTGQAGPVAALRLACQLAENAKTAAIWGALPEAGHNQIVMLDDGVGVAALDGDFFRDRADDLDRALPQIVLLRDDAGGEPAADRVDAVEHVANARGVPVRTVRAEGDGPIERVAGLIALCDFASVYLALARGIDPTPIAAIDELKAASATVARR